MGGSAPSLVQNIANATGLGQLDGIRRGIQKDQEKIMGAQRSAIEGAQAQQKKLQDDALAQRAEEKKTEEAIRTRNMQRRESATRLASNPVRPAAASYSPGPANTMAAGKTLLGA